MGDDLLRRLGWTPELWDNYWREQAERHEALARQARMEIGRLSMQINDKRFAQEQDQRIIDSADAQYFRWLLKHHSGTEAKANGQKRCWIGGVELFGDDIREAIDRAIERDEGRAEPHGDE